jgi:hypothetical protein
MPERRSHWPSWSAAWPVPNPARYAPVFSEDVFTRLLQLPRRRQRQASLLAQQLASHPFIRSDYTLSDEAGRAIEHLLMGDFVFSYWLDHATREVRITDIEDAS